MRIVILLFLLAVAGVSHAEQHFADIPNLKTVSGVTIENCRLGYWVSGELNADASNVIVFPTWFTGTAEFLESIGLIGPGKLADTNRYYVIAIDSLGNGVSCSPSNTADFPRISTTDMVRSQHRLLTEHLGVDHVHAVIGISMGGMQTFRWLQLYPEFMDKAVPMDGSPQMTSFDLVEWQTHKAVARAMQAGGHSNEEVMKMLARIGLLTLFTPDYFVENITREDLPGVVENSEKGYASLAADDYVAQLEAMIDHDVLDADGNLAADVKADVLVVGVPADHMVNPVPAKRLAERIGAGYFEVDSNCGHVGTSCEAEAVAARVNEFLAQ
jgi:homoserine O-acetyltransferase